MNNPSLSIIIPVYNAEEFIKQFFDELDLFLDLINIDAEVIFVNDASSDDSILLLNKIKDESKRSIVIFDFKKNVGQFAATSYAIKLAESDFIMTIDCDSSPSPLKLVELWEKVFFDTMTVNYFEFEQKKSFFRKIVSWLHQQYIRLSIQKKLNGHTGSSCRIFSKEMFSKIENQLKHQPEKLDVFLLNNALDINFINIEDYKSKNLSTQSTIRLVNYLSKLLFK